MKRNISLILFIVVVGLLSSALLVINKSYSYGLITTVSGVKGSRILVYTDATNNDNISFQDAYIYYDVPLYDYKIIDGETIYFEEGIETTKDNYERGYSVSEADKRALAYSTSSYRVHTTDEFKRALDDIYYNLRIGQFRIEFSNYENINLNEVKTYYDSHFGLTNPYQNYYNYNVKGLFEPDRFGFKLDEIKENEEMILDTYNIRISGNENVIIDKFVNSIMPYLHSNGTEYEKIYSAYTYVTNTATYLVDNGFINDFLSSNTSAYDGLINKQTVCIGYSITFSYIMDKMGIESYVVDQIVSIDPVNKTFDSVHSYNLVKLDGKYYRVDLTARIFLQPIDPNELYDKGSGKNLATSVYDDIHEVYVDFNAISNLLNQAKNTKTTTTTKVYGTSTIKTYGYEIPGTTQNPNPNNTGVYNDDEPIYETTGKITAEQIITSEKTIHPGKVITSTNKQGQIFAVVTNSAGDVIKTEALEKNENGELISKITNKAGEVIRTEIVKTNEAGDIIGGSALVDEEEKKQNNPILKVTSNINMNYILIPIACILVLFLLLKLVKRLSTVSLGKKVSINSTEVQDILNRDIINKEDDNNNNNNPNIRHF